MRNDTGVYEGGEISIYYDPMIAKLVTHAPTRAAAIEAQADALDAFAIDGIRHNIPFLSALMQHPRWRDGGCRPASSPRNSRTASSPCAPQGDVALRMLAVAAAIDHLHNERKRADLRPDAAGRRVRFERDRVVMLGREPHPVLVEDARRRSSSRSIDGNAAAGALSDWRPGEPVWTGTVDGEAVAVQVRPILNGYELSHAARSPRRASTPSARRSSPP